jgi:hypothetical protein
MFDFQLILHIAAESGDGLSKLEFVVEIYRSEEMCIQCDTKFTLDIPARLRSKDAELPPF